MQAPDFWQNRGWQDRLAALLLCPFGACYSAAVALKSRRSHPVRLPVPVISVGNLSVGGTGKTPVAIAVAQILAAQGLKTFFLSRGYGGHLAGPIRVMPEHRAFDVGDEPLLLAARGPTVVARHRARGGAMAVALGAQAIVMDDAHQNFAVAKDLSLVVVDATQGFGGGHVLPAGPLREYINQGLRRADAVVLVGEGAVDLRGFAGPVFRVALRHVDKTALKGARVLAFAGIGRPEKFFESLTALGADLVDTRRFADHHPYSQAEIATLRAAARERGAILVTTEKDYMRLTEAERQGIEILPIEAVFEATAAFEAWLDRIVARKDV